MTTRVVNRIVLVAAVAAASGAVGCSGGEPKEGVPLARAAASDSARMMASAHALIGPAALATLDTGNALYRKKDYAGALAKYREAAGLAPQHTAPIFGIYMVAKEQKNTALADSALAEIRKRSGPLSGGPHGMSDSALKALHDSLNAKGMPAIKGD